MKNIASFKKSIILSIAVGLVLSMYVSLLGSSFLSRAFADEIATDAKVVKLLQGEPLEGAYYIIEPYSSDTDSFADGSVDPRQIGPTNSDGTISLSGCGLVAGNMYSIYEGYEDKVEGLARSSGEEFRVEDDGSILDWWSASAAFPEPFENNTIVFETNPVSVLFDWTSLDGGMMREGDSAVFTISGKFVDAEKKELLITDDASAVAIDGFISGEKYTLIQLKAPFGHAVLDVPMVFTVIDQGNAPSNVVVFEGEEGSYATRWGEMTLYNKGLPYEYAPISVTIKKVDEQGNPLAGAKLSLHGTYIIGIPTAQTEGGMVALTEKSAITNSEGETVFSDLYEAESEESDTDDELFSTYQLSEITAPEGYEKIEAAPIIQLRDGKVSIIGNAAPGYTSVAGGGQVGSEQMSQFSVSEDGKTIVIVNKLLTQNAQSSNSLEDPSKNNSSSSNTDNSGEPNKDNSGSPNSATDSAVDNTHGVKTKETAQTADLFSLYEFVELLVLLLCVGIFSYREMRRKN